MATLPLFRKKFPLLVTGSLLALQPLGSSLASELYDCASSASGWACTPKSNASAQLPRPQTSAAPSEASRASGNHRDTNATLVSEAGGRGLSSRSADYSHLDWVPREQLSEAQLAETGPYCAGAYVEPLRPGMSDDTPLDEAPLFVSARASRYAQEQQAATLAGEVVLRQGRLQVEADEATLYQAENRGELNGHVRLRDNGTLVVGDRAELQLDNGAARIENAEYVMHKGHVRGSALYAKREENAIIRLKDGTYTRCEPGENTWQLKGNNVKLNPATGFGSATNVTLRVKDIPVFYTPYIYFPIDDRRQSGFLAPSFSSSSRTGFSLTTPYYFNLAPNYDATLYPNFMAKRGLLMEGELRYLTHSSEGQIGGAWLNDQEDERKLQSEYKDQRWLYNWQHRQGLDERLLAEVDYTEISDPYYFQDLRSNLENLETPSFLNQRGSLSWRGDSYTARLNLHGYQSTSVIDVTPYERLPQLTLDGRLPFNPGGLNLDYSAEYVRFERNLRSGNFVDENGGTQPWYDTMVSGLARANGQRIHVEPGISLPLEWSWGYLKPGLKYAHTQYNLSLDSTGKNSLGNSYDSSPSRNVPIASIDSGLYFDRNTRLFGTAFRQTLEPRAYYLYVPNEDQDDIPVFDTGEYGFSYAALFRDNRFSGRDRIGDENKLSLGLTSRWIEDNGFERQRVSVGQAFYLEDRKVQMPGIDYRERNDATASVSPLALAHLYRFNRDWRLSSELNWDSDSRTTRSGSLMFHYQPESNPNKVINAGYRYRNDTMRYDQASGKWTYGSDFGTAGQANYVKDYYKVQQHDVSVIWPLVPQWNLIGRWQHDYARSRTLEAFAGFEYDSCCWKLRLINRYWVDYDETSLNPKSNEDPDNGIFLQIVLKGLGSVLGGKTESYLEQGIEGYREREDQAF